MAEEFESPPFADIEGLVNARSMCFQSSVDKAQQLWVRWGRVARPHEERCFVAQYAIVRDGKVLAEASEVSVSPEEAFATICAFLWGGASVLGAIKKRVEGLLPHYLDGVRLYSERLLTEAGGDPERALEPRDKPLLEHHYMKLSKALDDISTLFDKAEAEAEKKVQFRMF